MRVCYVRFAHPAIAGAVTTATEAAKIDLMDTNTDPGTAPNGRLMFSRSDLHKISTAAGVSTLAVNKISSVDSDGNASPDTDLPAETADIAMIEGSSTANFEIRVANNQRYCEVWNTTTDEQELRSKN